MPDKTGRYTPQELAFIKGYVATGDKKQAGKAAGYSSPLVAANHVLARPAIAAEVARLQMERLTNEALPLAVGRIIEALEDPKTSTRDVNNLAKTVLAHTTVGDMAKGKEDHEKTLAELQMESAALQARLVQIERVTFDDATQPGGVFE